MGYNEVDKILDEIEKEGVIEYLSTDTVISVSKNKWYDHFDMAFDNITPTFVLLLIVALLTSFIWVTVLMLIAIFLLMYFILKEIVYTLDDLIQYINREYNNINSYISVYNMKGIKYYFEDKIIKKRLF